MKWIYLQIIFLAMHVYARDIGLDPIEKAISNSSVIVKGKVVEVVEEHETHEHPMVIIKIESAVGVKEQEILKNMLTVNLSIGLDNFYLEDSKEYSLKPGLEKVFLLERKNNDLWLSNSKNLLSVVDNIVGKPYIVSKFGGGAVISIETFQELVIKWTKREMKKWSRGRFVHDQSVGDNKDEFIAKTPLGSPSAHSGRFPASTTEPTTHRKPSAERPDEFSDSVLALPIWLLILLAVLVGLPRLLSRRF